jgi:hypothetical protein
MTKNTDRTNALGKDFLYFEQHRAQWARQHEGKFVLVVNAHETGFYDDYESAYRAGIQQCGPRGQFLIQQACAVEPVIAIY